VTDPATWFFETVEIGEQTADIIANWLELHWLTRHLWPAEITVDKGKEFAREVSKTLKNECGVKQKIITSRNPQANSMIERCHKTLHNMIRSAQIKDKRDLDSFLGFKGVLVACRKAMNSTVHATARATSTELVFGHDAMLNASCQADWQFIKERKQRLIIQNNKRENAKRKSHKHNAGDVAAVKAGTGCKHGSDPCLDPMRITQVNDNGTVKLVEVVDNNRGAASQIWNIRNVEPRMAWSPMCHCPWHRKTASTWFKNSRVATSLAFQAFYMHFSTHLDRCHGGECNTLKLGIKWSVLIRDSLIRDSFTEDTLLSIWVQLPLALPFTSGEEHCSEE